MRINPSHARYVFRRLAYHINSIWLFTYSDIKTIIGPSTVFGFLHLLAAPAFGLQIETSHSLLLALSRIPVTAFWAWSNLLPFAIDNQRQPSAIQEDSLNKPWRTMPSNRMSSTQARTIMAIMYCVAVVNSAYLGGLRQCLSLIFLGVWYNDLGGADASCLTRNLINACGFVCYTSGALEVAIGQQLEVNSRLITWFLIISGIVFTTVHTQDMYDQPGDSLRGRKSVPLVIGDAPARWVIFTFMLIWCWLVPSFWNLSLLLHVPCVALGTMIAFRSISKRSIPQDKTTFRLWNLWLVTCYAMPLVARQFLPAL